MSLSTHGTLVVPLSVRQMALFAHGVLFRAVPCVRWPFSRTESCFERFRASDGRFRARESCFGRFRASDGRFRARSPVSNGSVHQMALFAHGVLFRTVPCVRWPISHTGVLRGSYGPGHGPMRRNRYTPERRKNGIPCNYVTCPRP